MTRLTVGPGSDANRHLIGITYTAQELEDIYGERWKWILGLESPRLPQKHPVHKFEDFDAHHKQIYQAIYEIVAEYNQDPSVKVYACGSRIKGNWKTVAEAEALSIECNRYIKPSDYDYWTPALKPRNEYLTDRLGVKVDCNRDWVDINRLVLITPKQ